VGFVINLEVEAEPNHSIGEASGKCGREKGFGATNLEKEEVITHESTLSSNLHVLTV